MSVAGEINVVDSRMLEHGCLLPPDVWRKKEDPVLRSAGGQGRSASVQLLDYDPNILVAEVSPLLDEVPSHARIVGSVRPGRCLLGRPGKMLAWVSCVPPCAPRSTRGHGAFISTGPTHPLSPPRDDRSRWPSYGGRASADRRFSRTRDIVCFQWFKVVPRARIELATP